ncbi:hypothetical protein B0H19DRAFT_995847 [Mycena capillaripes]|nr:hypothetical protein B0H19DRAFT_995847 [Mycena capillaripes]
MRFITLLSAVYIFTSGASAIASANVSLEVVRTASGITAGNCYGAPIPPWQQGCYPGWYYGNSQNAPTGLACLVDGVCSIPLFYLAVINGTQSSSLPSPYSYTFTNRTCAAQVWPLQLYLTFGIVDSIPACCRMCDTVSKCIFGNTYHDNNAGAGKNNTTQLTCALFSVVVPLANVTNCGGQQQQSLPNGKTYITESYGFSKPVATK